MRLQDVVLRSTRALQPAATAVPIGALSYVTDEGVLERSNGTGWQDISPVSVAAPHTHPESDIIGLVADLAAKAAASHTHAEADVTGLVADLAAKAAASHSHAEADVTGLVADLAAKAAATHTHAEADVTGLVADLAGKAPASHSHAEADVTNLVTDLAAKAALVHASRHVSGGADAIKLDDLAAPDDNTDLNASTAAHGLVPKLPNDATKYYNGVGAFTVPAGGGGGAWVLAATNSPTAQTTVDITGLAGASSIRVLVRNMTQSANAILGLQVSTDNGATWLTASGDYKSINGAGVETNQTSLLFFFGGTTAPRSGEIAIEGCTLTAPKVARSNFYSTDDVNLRVIPVAAAINAVRVMSTGAGTLSAGTIWVFTR
jgi:hypothetical protein